MTLPKVAIATSTAALPSKPERPVKYACPVTTPDGSIGYDRPLENYFDTSKATHLAPPNLPANLYETIAGAHDHRFTFTPSQYSTKNPRINTPTNPTLPPRHLAKLTSNSPDYMGISPDLPGWRPRRSSYEDRRGAVPVAPGEVNDLVPYIPPIDTSMPPPSKEWLDRKAREILGAVTMENRNETNGNEHPSDADDENDMDWGYDTDSTVDAPSLLPRRATQAPLTPPAAEESDSDDDPFYSDTDIDSDHDERYTWTRTDSTAHISQASPRALADVPKWVIPRKQPSVVFSEDGDVCMGGDYASASDLDRAATTPPPSSGDEFEGRTRKATGTKRKGRNLKPAATQRSAKKPKRNWDDTPARRGRRSIGHAAYGTSTSPPFERATSLPPPITKGHHAHTPGNQHTSASPLTPRSHSPISPRSRSPISPLTPSPTSTPLPARIPTSRPAKPTSFPCPHPSCPQICASQGDLSRHLLSLRHTAPSFACLSCGRSYTRADALKRHLRGRGCRRGHLAAAARQEQEGLARDGQEGDGQAQGVEG
ncbi:hypothetical protein HYDPIDRAFT_188792 [Hydnomerulius pinastri MD-312]|uniref:C2H2-type domain-containing protein n=1 Tax=Hydnomerulius pinastri MD-312 TaxID=994086 RepID=A0A0C9WDY5_9AGAM|nr:hypothetical protein HYDPIDRAFT_188792 [Hydnomerulius pinastri MD-312]